MAIISAELITLTGQQYENATGIKRSHLLASLNFQGELDFKEAAHHLKEAGLLELSEECLKLKLSDECLPNNNKWRKT